MVDHDNAAVDDEPQGNGNARQRIEVNFYLQPVIQQGGNQQIGQ